jgi:hypothetical protein
LVDAVALSCTHLQAMRIILTRRDHLASPTLLPLTTFMLHWLLIFIVVLHSIREDHVCTSQDQRWIHVLIVLVSGLPRALLLL